MSRSDRGKQLTAFARIGALGIELALSVVIGVLGGRWLDRKLSTEPYLTLVGLLLGTAAGFKSLVQTARRQQKKQQAQDGQQDAQQDETRPAPESDRPRNPRDNE